MIVVLAACATQHPNPAWWKRYDSFLSGTTTTTQPFGEMKSNLGVRNEPGGLKTFEILDKQDQGGPVDNDPMNHPPVARIEHATGTILYGAAFRAFETKNPRTGVTSWFSVSTNDSGFHTVVDVFSPPLRDVAQIPSNGGHLVAVRLSDELYLPVTDNGAPAWLPSGVVGAKPLMVPAAYIKDDDDASIQYWRGWLMRWEGKVSGWSLARGNLRRDDPSASVPAWKDVKITKFASRYGTLYGVLGTRFDGSCEAAAFHKDDAVVQPEDTVGASCDVATTNMLARYDALVQQNKELLAQFDIDEKRNRDALEQTRQAELQRRLAEIAAMNAYEAAVQPHDGKPAEWTAELCELTKAMDAMDHAQVVARRVFFKLALPGEQACVEGRSSVAKGYFHSQLEGLAEQRERQKRDAILAQQREQEERDRARAERDAADAARYAEAARYEVPSTSVYSSRDPQAAEKLYDAQFAWVYGTHRGLCPFSDLSLCN